MLVNMFMFITAVCVLFLIKLWLPKNKSLYNKVPVGDSTDYSFEFIVGQR